MITTAEAISFVTEVLDVSCPAERSKSDRFTLLAEIIKAFHGVIPFQSLSLIAVEPKNRRSAPSLEEIKADVTSGKGGLCYSLNTFMKLLLQALGYEVYHVISSIVKPDNHILTIVRNLQKPGDKFLVDVGIGYPTFDPVPLDFVEESSVYKQSFLEYKFVWVEGMLVRFHRKGELRPMKEGEVVIDGWRKVCIIDPTPRDLTYFQKPMDKVYSDPSLSPFHTSLRVVYFPRGKAVCIRDNCLLVENDSHELVGEPLADGKEIVDKVRELFPLLTDTALSAIDNMKIF